jgi:competence protein ComEC
VFSPPPDLLISADARLIAFRSADRVFLQKLSGASSFTLEMWQTLWPGAPPQPFPQTGEAGQGAIACTDAFCLLRSRPRAPAALLVRDEIPPLPCDQAAVVISAEPAGHICPDLPRVDRFSVWRDGAHAVWLGSQGVDILSDRAVRGDRPWVPPLPAPRPRKVPDLPLAKPEQLPPAASQ